MPIRLSHGPNGERLELGAPEEYPPDVNRPTAWARLDTFDKAAEPSEPIQVCSRCGNEPHLHGKPDTDGRDNCGCPPTPDYLVHPERYPTRPNTVAMVHPLTQRPRPKPPKAVPG
jgi:hypothetical protein